MSCSKHPDSKQYHDRRNNRDRCADCVKGRIAAASSRQSVTQSILDSLGKDAEYRPSGAVVHRAHTPAPSWAQCVAAITQ